MADRVARIEHAWTFMRTDGLFEHRPPAPNQAEYQAAVLAEQVEALYRAPAIMLVNPINASILAVVLGQAYPAWILLLWIGLFCVVVSIRFVDRARYLRQPRDSGPQIIWAKRFAVGAAATGFLWGLAGSVVFVSPDPVAHVVVTFVLGGMMVGAVSQHSAYLPAFFSYTLPAIVPQVLCYVAKGDRVSIAMGLMLAAYVAVVALMGRYINRMIVQSVRLRLDQAASTNEIEQIYRYSPVGLCFMDTDYRYVRINEHMAEINGLPVGAHIGRTLRDVIPGLADKIMELYRPVYERGESVLNAEIQSVAPMGPGVQRCYLANFFPLRSESGKVTGLIGAVTDITDLKQTQSALRQSEERFRTIFDSVNDLIFVHDFETAAVVEVNQRVCEMFG
jgi:PAS domain S-box-containing protein